MYEESALYISPHSTFKHGGSPDGSAGSWCTANGDEVDNEEFVLQSPLPDGSAGDAHLQLGCSVVKDVEDIEGLHCRM